MVNTLKCPLCEIGTLKNGKIEQQFYGVVLGTFLAEICNKCGESFTDQNTTQAIELAAKKKGLWGLGKKTKITRSGNSLAVRIPKDIVKYLHLKEGEDAYIHPEGNRIIIDAK